MKEDVLLVGNSARGHAIAEALARSNPRPSIFAWMEANNPGIADLSEAVKIGNYDDLGGIAIFARSQGATLAVIDPEKPLYHGVADALETIGVPTVGPLKALARVETEKSFAMDLMAEYGIPGRPKFKTFRAMEGIKEYLEKNGPAALKPDKLTGGKGVKVQGEHFTTVTEAMEICEEILVEHGAVVIQEKLVGEEFTAQFVTDGMNVVASPLVQDLKRRLVGDRGFNVGSMGSWSCANHLLPFVTPAELHQAVQIVRQTVAALFAKTGKLYKGIIYGSFMITRDGVKLIEFNARFGDPEAINVLPLLKTDFLDICRSIVRPDMFGGLDSLKIEFAHLATVVKYVVPVGYGLPKGQHVPVDSDLIQIGDLGQAKLYYSSVNQDAAGIHLTSSRAVAILGVSPDLAEAERIAEQGACAITGAVAHRWDIGTDELINKRVRHMEELRRTK